MIQLKSNSPNGPLFLSTEVLQKLRCKMKNPVKKFSRMMAEKYDGIVSKLMIRYHNDTDRLSDDIRFWNALASAMAWRKLA